MQHHRRIQKAVVAGIFVVSSWCLADQPQYQINSVGLTGPIYKGIPGSLPGGTTTGTQSNASGLLAGDTARYNAQGAALGQDSWIQVGNTYQQIGFVGGVYGYTLSSPGGGTYEHGLTVKLNDNGQVLGQSDRYASDGSSLGSDIWIYSSGLTKQVGLTGAGYVNNALPGGPAQYSTTIFGGLTNSGMAAGTTARFRSDNNAMGNDAWIYNGSTTQIIGLSGSAYESSINDALGGSVHNQSAYAINGVGQVIGFAQRFTPNGQAAGQDTWLYNGATTQQVGLTGTNYSFTPSSGGTSQSSNAYQINNTGQVLGSSNRYSSTGANLGQDAWLFNGTTTVALGLQGTIYGYAGNGGTFQSSAVDTGHLNNSGVVTGTSTRYASSGSSLGQDSWIYNGSQTHQIGLTGGAFSYSQSGQTFQSSNPQFINNNGQVIGTSARYGAGGGDSGQSAWFCDGSTTAEIGLTGAGFSYNANGTPYVYASPITINDAGDVIGENRRFTGTSQTGLAGWYFDPKTNTTYQIGPDSDAFVTPSALTSTGVVLGTYTGGGSSSTGVFYWTEAGGFRDLGTLVNGSLSAQGWSALQNVLASNFANPDGSPVYLFGQGQLPGTNDFNAFILSAVPEPATLSVVGFATVMALTRRRGR